MLSSQMGGDFISQQILCTGKVGFSMVLLFMHLIIAIILQFQFINFTLIKVAPMEDGDWILIQQRILRMKVGYATESRSRFLRTKSIIQFQFINTIMINKTVRDIILVMACNQLMKDGQKMKSLFMLIKEKYNERNDNWSLF